MRDPSHQSVRSLIPWIVILSAAKNPRVTQYVTATVVPPILRSLSGHALAFSNDHLIADGLTSFEMPVLRHGFFAPLRMTRRWKKPD
jgi:hypothetical protein